MDTSRCFILAISTLEGYNCCLSRKKVLTACIYTFVSTQHFRLPFQMFLYFIFWGALHWHSHQTSLLCQQLWFVLSLGILRLLLHGLRSPLLLLQLWFSFLIFMWVLFLLFLVLWISCLHVRLESVDYYMPNLASFVCLIFLALYIVKSYFLDYEISDPFSCIHFYAILGHHLQDSKHDLIAIFVLIIVVRSSPSSTTLFFPYLSRTFYNY